MSQHIDSTCTKTNIMGGHIEKTCSICFKKMRGDNLNRHMEKHKVLLKAENNHVTKCSNNYETLKKEVIYQNEEFKRLEKTFMIF